MITLFKRSKKKKKLKKQSKFVLDDARQIARQIESLSFDEAARVIEKTPVTTSPQVMRYLNDAPASQILQRLAYPIFQAIMEQMDSQQCASIFFHFPNHLRELLLLQLDKKKKREVQEILTFPEDSAGRLMAKDFLCYTNDMTVQEVTQHMRQEAKVKQGDSYIYVVNREKKLVGILSLRDLILAEPETPLVEAMHTDVTAVHSFLDRDSVVKEITAKNYFALPVIDSENHLLGVVRARQILDDVQVSATENLQQMFGVGSEERVFSKFGFSLGKRLPWLHVNLATTFLAAFVLGMFESTLSQITVLALFLPIVAGAGNGAQSLAVVMRGLALREIPASKVKKLIGKEFLLGMTSGVVVGGVTAAVSWVWKGNPYLGLVVGLGMIINFAAAGLAGATIPLMMKRVGIDPAQCSTFILTTVTDVVGYTAFLGLAMAMKGYLI